jgi:F-type H+-transporting ATPase subunit b
MDIYPNFTVFFQIANFLLLLLILNFTVYRPIRRILGQRGDEFLSFQGMIEDFRNRSGKDTKTLEENMASARSEGFKEKENLKNAGLEEEKVTLQGAISSADEKIGTLEEEVKVFSKELAEKLLGRSI